MIGDKPTPEEIAAQLREPSGEMGLRTASAMNKSNEILSKMAFTSLDIQDNDTLLEIGMGNGKFTEQVIAKAKNIVYTGCDHSALMVEEAIKGNQELIESGQVKFIQGFADDLPFEENSFDHVFCANVIYFWEAPSLELQEISRVLKPSGKLAIAFRPRSKMQEMPFTQHGFHLYEEAEIAELLTENGFTEISVVKEDELQKFQEDEYNWTNIVILCRKP